jgi:dissimilatory sulfite reductase (desulfoviridin) alpha/beta subunit
MTMEACRNCRDSHIRKHTPNGATEPHPCPFKQELYNDDEPCTCCNACVSDCADEV